MISNSFSVFNFRMESITQKSKKYELTYLQNLYTGTIHKDLTFEEMFLGFCNSHSDLNDDKDDNRTFSITSKGEWVSYPTDTKPIFRYITGTISSGEYGLISNLVNIDTNEVEFKRREKHADVMPFHFIVAVPVGANCHTGAIGFQNIGSYGVKTVFHKFLTNYLRQDEFRIKLRAQIHTQVTDEYVEAILNSLHVQKITFIDKENDDRYSDGETQFGFTSKEVILKNPLKQNLLRRALSDIFQGKRTVRDVFEIEGIDNYDETKVTIDTNGVTRTLTIGNLEKLRFAETIDINNYRESDPEKVAQLEKTMIEKVHRYLVQMKLIESEG